VLYVKFFGVLYIKTSILYLSKDLTLLSHTYYS
jgi:hypothetical protein